MKTYTVKIQYVFEGAFEVKADSKQEARRIVDEDCGLVLGGDIHTTSDEDVTYWDFSIHPDKNIKSVKNRKMKR